MCESQALPSSLYPAEEWTQCLLGYELTHVISVASMPDMDVVSRVTAHLSQSETPVRSLTVLRNGNILDQKIVIDGIGERGASFLRQQLLNLDGVLRVRLEHRLTRPKAAGGAGR
jgi:hypothetical protein